jgi:hypothetical protein
VRREDEVTTTGLRIVEHRRGWCTMGVKHDPHPFQELDSEIPNWVDFWCTGEPPSDEDSGQLVVVLYNDDCWCQDADALNVRMNAAIGHVLDRVRELITDNQEDDTWMDRWGDVQSREIVVVDDLLRELEKLQQTEEDTEEVEGDDDES